jgi:predicted alpha/beta superfamily hydrolase
MLFFSLSCLFCPLTGKFVIFSLLFRPGFFGKSFIFPGSVFLNFTGRLAQVKKQWSTASNLEAY